VTLARAIERLMIMDAVIAEPNLQWLGSEPEKEEYFRSRTAFAARRFAVAVVRSGTETAHS
jgi:hypothetical protein